MKDENYKPIDYEGAGAKRIIHCMNEGCETKIKAPKNHPWNIIGWLGECGWIIKFKGNRFFPFCPNHVGTFNTPLRANAKGYKRPE